MNKLYVVSENGRRVGFSSRGPAAWAILRILARNPHGIACAEIAVALLDDKCVLETYEIESILARLCSEGQVRRTGKKYAIASPLSVTSVLDAAIESGVKANLDAAPEPTTSKDVHGLTKVDRTAIDWVLPDAYIAQQQGVCRERIRQIRLDLPAPASPLKNQRKSTVDLYIWISKNRFRAAGLTAGEVVDASGLAVNSRQIAAAMAAAGIPWETQSEKKIGSARALAGEFNWDLPNRDLSRTWGMHHVAVAKYRSRLAAGPARWDGRRLSNGRRRRLPIDYLEALVAERLNASGRLRGVG